MGYLVVVVLIEEPSEATESIELGDATSTLALSASTKVPERLFEKDQRRRRLFHLWRNPLPRRGLVRRMS